jgi:formyl-CoA transferase
MSTSLFSGVTVLELGQIIAGPFAASMLADFGATVIKVEQPGYGDTLRTGGPT